MAHEHGEPIDSILFSEVMFDKKNGISGENPQHIDFIKNRAKPLFESWGYKVYILHAERDFLDVFNHTIDNPRKIMEHKGMKYGFPASGMCVIQRDCKVKAINKFLKSIDDKVIQYVGICIDEPERLKSLKSKSGRVSLLEKYGYTEQMAKELCIKYDLMSPGYKNAKRGGCWFCPNAKFEEHKEIRRLMPNVWKQYVDLETKDDVVYKKWCAYSSETLHDRDVALMWDERQMTIFDYYEQQN